MDRVCERCVYQIDGMCSRWECHMETLEEHDERIAREVAGDMANLINHSHMTINEIEKEVLSKYENKK